MTESAADRVVLHALSTARADSNRARLYGQHTRVAGFVHGYAVGQLAVARWEMGADPVLAQSAENEVRFLFTDYVERGHA